MSDTRIEDEQPTHTSWVFRNGVELLRLLKKYDGYATAIRGGLICVLAGLRLTILRVR